MSPSDSTTTRYAHLSEHLTSELWLSYVPNALRTEPPALKLLHRWGVVTSHWAGESYEQLAMRVSAGTQRCLAAEQHLWMDLSKIDNPLRLLHAAIGMSTELHEMRTAPDEDNYIEELGDVCWYMALAWPALFKDIQEFEEVLSGTVIGKFLEGSLADVVADIKKLAMYGKEDVRTRLRSNYCAALIEISHRASESQVAGCFRNVLDLNSRKLLDPKAGRYASGAYSDSQAIERKDKGGAED